MKTLENRWAKLLGKEPPADINVSIEVQYGAGRSCEVSAAAASAAVGSGPMRQARPGRQPLPVPGRRNAAPCHPHSPTQRVDRRQKVQQTGQQAGAQCVPGPDDVDYRDLGRRDVDAWSSPATALERMTPWR